MDFTLRKYHSLVKALESGLYEFRTFKEYFESSHGRFVILRHDVDRKPQNSLLVARLLSSENIRGTFYFRSVPQSWDEKIIHEIALLGHEVGYHYEDLSLVAPKLKFSSGAFSEKIIADRAFESFVASLSRLRRIVPVATICMHGNPLSRWDNRLLWKYYDYRELGLAGEPYFDMDVSNMLYLTDTGRRWDGDSVSVRDKAANTGKFNPGHGGVHAEYQYAGNYHAFENWKVMPLAGSLMRIPRKGRVIRSDIRLRSTEDIIAAIGNDELPSGIQITFHPQRWNKNALPWMGELIMQNIKNPVKYFLVRLRKS